MGAAGERRLGHGVKPEIFGDYLLIERLSSGSGDAAPHSAPGARRSMTEVFRAVALGDKSGRSFVVKRVPLGEPASGAIAESLRREAAALGAEGLVNCPRLVRAGELAGLPYLVVEFVEGVSLARLAELGKLEPDLALGIGRSLARVLAKVHAAGFVHGDVSPENVLVDDLGEVHLLDFGLAYAARTPRDAPGGKPGYVAPEAAVGKPAQPADDVYGWGVVIAEALLGRHLFHEVDLAEAAARPESLPPELDAHEVVARALSRDVAARPAAADLALLAGVADGSVLAELASAAMRNQEPARTPRAAPRSRAVQGLLKPVDAKPPIDPKALLEETKALAAPRPRFDKGTVFALSLGLVFALAIGLVVGRRFPVKSGEASITFPMLPARTEVELDGAIIVVPEPGRAIPIEAGKHRVSIQVGRRDATEYEFVAEPGEHVVVVSLNPARVGLTEEPEKDPKGKLKKGPKN